MPEFHVHLSVKTNMSQSVDYDYLQICLDDEDTMHSTIGKSSVVSSSDACIWCWQRSQFMLTNGDIRTN